MPFRATPATASPGTDLAALAMLGDMVSDPAILAEGELVITHTNAAAELLFEAASGSLEGRRLDELVPEEVRATFRHAAREGGVFVLDLESAASHPLAGRRCLLQRAGDSVALVVAPDAIPSISDMVRQLNQTLEFERIVHLVARHATELLRARRAAVFVLDGDRLTAVGSAGSDVLPAGTVLPLDETFSGTAIRALRAVRLADVRATAARWPRLAYDASGDPRPNALAAPLLIGGRPIGAVCVAGRSDGDFDAADERLLAKLADHAAIAVENARLYSAAARAARYASMLVEAQQRERVLSEASAEIARLALGDDDLPTVAGALLDVVDRIVPTAAMVLSALTEPDTVEYVAGTGAGMRLRGIRVPLQESLLSRLQMGAEVVLPDVHSVILPAWREHAPDGQAVLFPLVARQRIIGMLGAATPRGEALDEAHVAELRQLAASMALAVDALLLAEEERRRTAREREMAAALATMDQPVLVLDLDGRIRGANQAAEREYGYTLAELTEMHVTRLAPSDRAPTPAWGNAVIPGDPALTLGGRSSGPRRVAESVHRRRDGSEFPVSVTRGTIRDEEGRAVGHVLGVRNLSEERRVAEQLRQHERLAALGSLVAGVAHELNNPLTGISAFSQLLLEEGLDEEQTEAVRLIKREADRAVGVIRDLLLFSRKTGAPLSEVDVNAVLQLAVRLRTYTLRAERIEVALDLDESSPRAMGDEHRLQQVFLNLIVNAEHAMNGRDERRLTLRTNVTGAHLVVEVNDTGSGMSGETLAHVFEPFFTTKPAGTGTGLGLSVSYGIVQAHGGAIAVDSTPGVGTTFRITLPLARAAEWME